MVTPEQITLGLSAVGAIVWLIRLEGRVNTAEKEQTAMRATFDTFRAEARVAEKAHSETALEIVRLQEQIKHLTDLIERLVDPSPTPRRRAAT